MRRPRLEKPVCSLALAGQDVNFACVHGSELQCRAYAILRHQVLLPRHSLSAIRGLRCFTVGSMLGFSRKKW